MPRANRIRCKGYIWHITHRCHRKSFFLKFARDRRRWRHWLLEATRRYGLTVLDYIATSNHVHLLVEDQGNDEVSKSMQLVAGRTAQEFNKRKNKKGAFWDDRYHATAVQSNEHFLRCLVYIDLNMVRAGVVEHPRDWEVSGYHEIQMNRRRNRIIDFDSLRRISGIHSFDDLRRIHDEWIDSQLGVSRRDPAWTECVGVGDDKFLLDLKERLGVAGYSKNIRPTNGNWTLRDAANCYIWQF